MAYANQGRRSHNNKKKPAGERRPGQSKSGSMYQALGSGPGMFQKHQRNIAPSMKQFSGVPMNMSLDQIGPLMPGLSGMKQSSMMPPMQSYINSMQGAMGNRDPGDLAGFMNSSRMPVHGTPPGVLAPGPNSLHPQGSSPPPYLGPPIGMQAQWQNAQAAAPPNQLVSGGYGSGVWNQNEQVMQAQQDAADQALLAQGNYVQTPQGVIPRWQAMLLGLA